MIAVLLGPPGAGKGSQATLLVQRYGLEHLSSGELLRWNCREQTAIGKQTATYLDEGQLVPDALISAIMIDAIMRGAQQNDGVQESSGFLLDGFPRTLGQANSLDRELEKVGRKVDLVLNLQVDDSRLEQRISGRWTCSKCGRVYHLDFLPPVTDGICDDDGQTLYQRPDDTPEVVRMRIKTYHEQTQPLVDYYEKCGNIAHIDGNGAITDIAEAVYDVIDQMITSVQ